MLLANNGTTELIKIGDLSGNHKGGWARAEARHRAVSIADSWVDVFGVAIEGAGAVIFELVYRATPDQEYSHPYIALFVTRRMSACARRMRCDVRQTHWH